MSKRVLRLIFLGVFLATISAHTIAFAQLDSLVDCFPLSNGNRWIYHYDHTISEETGTNEISTFDTGSAVYTILGRSDFADSALWLFKERRDLRHFVRDWSGTLTDSTITDSVLFNLVEIKSGRHEIYRHADYLGSLWVSDSGALGNTVILFQPIRSDT